MGAPPRSASMTLAIRPEQDGLSPDAIIPRFLRSEREAVKDVYELPYLLTLRNVKLTAWVVRVPILPPNKLVPVQPTDAKPAVNLLHYLRIVGANDEGEGAGVTSPVHASTGHAEMPFTVNEPSEPMTEYVIHLVTIK